MQPLRGAIVSAVRAGTKRPGVDPVIGFRTGLDGKFTLRGVATGVVNFYVSKPGVVAGPYASVRPAADGEQVDNVVLTVQPAASVSGRVFDESGQPAVGAIVTIPTSSQHAASDPAASPATDTVPVPQQRVTSVRTDDEGRYWIGGLDAGEIGLTVRPYGSRSGIHG